MLITYFYADGFKNLGSVAISPSPAVNVVFGENAQGKTNLVEAIWILSGARSFRGSKERDMIGFGRDFARLELVLKDSEREQRIEAVLSAGRELKKITLNGVKQRSLASLFGVLKCVVFTPEDLELSKGSPDCRRDFIDLCISQIKPAYAKTVLKYENVLSQRNALLKHEINDPDSLDVWDEQLARLGAYITVVRSQYTKKLDIFASKLYSELTGGREKLNLEYKSSVYKFPGESHDWQDLLFREHLNVTRETRADDIRAGFTTRGIHRDDVLVRINGNASREFGSQGQNRSAALAMKLSQAYILCEETSEMPVILLDDVLSELDSKRREFIVTKLKGMQIFITCCEPTSKLKGKKFEMRGGRIT